MELDKLPTTDDGKCLELLHRYLRSELDIKYNISCISVWFTHKFKELLQDLHIYANNFFFHLTLPRDIWVSEKAAFWFLESLWENAKINQANRRSRFCSIEQFFCNNPPPPLHIHLYLVFTGKWLFFNVENICVIRFIPEDGH